nr:putative reverse transcriptase domain-containing protein [Tanacetum cinerariifolium]
HTNVALILYPEKLEQSSFQFFVSCSYHPASVLVLVIRPLLVSSIFLLLKNSIIDTIDGQTVGHTHSTLNSSRMNRATTLGGNRPNPVLAIKGNPNQGNNRNQARGSTFALGVLKAPQDPNVVIDLILGAMPLAKSPYRLAPTKMQELSNHLKELKEKDLIPGAMPLAKSPYRFAPTKMQELSNQLKEPQDKGKANVVADALSMKEWMKPRRVRALSMTIYFSIKDRILEASMKFIRMSRLQQKCCEDWTNSLKEKKTSNNILLNESGCQHMAI